MRRRTWILGAAAATGALLVGWMVAPQRPRLGARGDFAAAPGEVALNGWIKVRPDGRVVLAMPRSEMGQGVYTALPMLAAEELDLPLDRLEIEQAGSDRIYGNLALLSGWLPFHPLDAEREDGFGRIKASRWVVGKIGRELGINATGGSTSVADAWDVVRLAAATARASLLGAASLHWRLPLEELQVRDGVVFHSSGRSASYGELARFAAATPPGEVRLKERKDWRLIGRPAPRKDLLPKVTGRAGFGIDVRLPGLKYAALRLAPMLGGAPGRVDGSAALAMPGVERIVMLPAYAGAAAGFAVVADNSWRAQRAAALVQVEWRPGRQHAPDSDAIAGALRKALDDDGFTFYSKGAVAPAEAAAARRVEATYSAPYLAHATLEPMNCTARVGLDKVELWVPTQVPQMCRAAAARVAGVPLEQVEVHVTLLGGGFGRRLEVDYAALAVRVAMDCGGAPVQLLWSREEDMRHDFYRPAQAARLQATLDASGALSSLRIKAAGDAISPRWLERCMPAMAGPVDLPDKTAVEGLFDQAYAIPHQVVEHVSTRMGVPVGYWRSVGHSHNAFFLESFIDEVAAALGRDPAELRLELLADAPRHRAVLQLALQRSGWGSRPLPARRARGLAFHESFGTPVALVMEVGLDAAAVRVHRVVCALDCGTVVNPAIVAQQVEGAVLYGLSAALHGQVDIRMGQVQQGNFPDHPLIRMAAAPVVETWLVPSERPPSGVGEPAVPPVAPALANALFVLTGQRLRDLPLRLEQAAKVVL